LRRGMVRMIDIAGLDETRGDEISNSMQQHAHRAIDEADLVMLVRESGDVRPPLSIERKIDLHVMTKIDLHPEESGVSAMTGENINVLRDRLDMLAFVETASGAMLALNSRHVQAIQNCREILSRANLRDVAEITAMELREALDVLGGVLGSVTPDDVLGKIFATFCVGK
jgi:tRNA modification GTPase